MLLESQDAPDSNHIDLSLLWFILFESDFTLDSNQFNFFTFLKLSLFKLTRIKIYTYFKLGVFMTRIRIIGWLESVEQGIKIFVLSYSTSLTHLAQIMRCSHCILYITTLDCQWNKNHVFYWFKLGVKKNLKVFWKLWKIEILCTLFKSCTYLDSNQIKKRQNKVFQTLWIESYF